MSFQLLVFRLSLSGVCWQPGKPDSLSTPGIAFEMKVTRVQHTLHNQYPLSVPWETEGNTAAAHIKVCPRSRDGNILVYITVYLKKEYILIFLYKSSSATERLLSSTRALLNARAPELGSRIHVVSTVSIQADSWLVLRVRYTSEVRYTLERYETLHSCAM